MSVNYDDIKEQQVLDEVNNLLKQGLRLSVVYSDTYYLYATNKDLLVNVTKTNFGKDKEEYDFGLSNVGIDKVNLPEYFVHDLYKYIDHNYGSGNVGPHLDIDMPFSKEDAIKFIEKHNKFGLRKDQDFVSDLVYKMIHKKCPVDLIQRVIYFLDKSTDIHNFSENFTLLNHDNKLIEYNSPRGKTWQFVGEKIASPFYYPSEKSNQLFGLVRQEVAKRVK